jgi:Uma2 family endonuclease
MTRLHALDSSPTHSLVAFEKRYVTEEEYWEEYYHCPDVTYEWNHGYLEEKGVSDIITTLVYQWLLRLLDCYLQTTAYGQMIGLETGFRLVLPRGVKIRRPDLGIVLNTNPIPWLPEDKSYQGTFDLCLEAISDSSQQDIERDTIEKKRTYAQAGVKEYYILDGHDRYTAFYYLNQQGVYLPIKPTAENIIQSTVLPGLQFRRADLFTRPTIETMAEDPVYPFVFPAFRETKQARVVAEALAQEERQARIKEELARIAAESQIQQMAEKLHALDIDPKKL